MHDEMFHISKMNPIDKVNVIICNTSHGFKTFLIAYVTFPPQIWIRKTTLAQLFNIYHQLNT